MTERSELWAVTCFYNPAGFRSRLRNYRIFRERLRRPLVAVELGYGADFELEPGDAEILIQLRCPDVLWQKERLLNLAVEVAPPEAEKVAWLDCDIVFLDDDWAEKAARALDEFDLVHLFSRRINLPRGAGPEAWRKVPAGEYKRSIVDDWRRGLCAAETFAEAESQRRLGRTAGLAWGARRSVLAEHGIYDAAILGNGDRLVMGAGFGLFEPSERSTLANAAQRRHYRAWAEPFHETVRGRVGAVDQTVCHLWHGGLENRRYTARYEGLAPFEFDPRDDIALDESGCWRWASDKPEMHRYVREYFLSRREDD